jgi:hypothetical protein
MSTVSKLRFMQKASQDVPSVEQQPKGDLAPESHEIWSLGEVDPASVRESVQQGDRLRTINVVARRSYGGANPFVEQMMQSQEKSRKRSKPDSASKGDSPLS